MALFAYVLVIISASFAEASLSDTVTLLQGQVQQKILKPPSIDMLVEPDDDYLLAESSKCAGEQPTASTSMETLDELSALDEAPSAGISAQKDPPAASVFKKLLALGLALLIVDGMRRCLFRKEDADKHKDEAKELPNDTWVVMMLASLSCLGCRSRNGGANKHEGDGNKLSNDAWVAMVNAASIGDQNSFETALIDNEACVMQTDTWGCSLLHFAAVGGSADIATTLLKKRADVDALDAFDETPLHLAARADHASICEVLLDAGAAIDAVNVEGMTSQLVAACEDAQKACNILAERGAGAAGLADNQLPLLVVGGVIKMCSSTRQ